MRTLPALLLIATLAAAGGAVAQNGEGAKNGGAPRDAPVAGARVVLVQGVAGAIGEEFTGALRQRLGSAQPLNIAEVGDAAALDGAQVIVAAGAAALKDVLARKPSVPVVAALVPRATFEEAVASGPAGAPPVSAIHLDQPFARQLAVARAALPQAGRLGVLLGPDSARVLPWLERAAREGGWQLVVARAQGPALRTALDRVLLESDAVLVVPDPQVFNASTLQAILLGSYRQGKPLIGVSPAYTRAGALFSVFASPVQLAVETAELVRRGLAEALPPARYSQGFEVQVNRQVARSLGIDLSEDDALRSAGERR